MTAEIGRNITHGHDFPSRVVMYLFHLTVMDSLVTGKKEMFIAGVCWTGVSVGEMNVTLCLKFHGALVHSLMFTLSLALSV